MGLSPGDAEIHLQYDLHDVLTTPFSLLTSQFRHLEQLMFE